MVQVPETAAAGQIVRMQAVCYTGTVFMVRQAAGSADSRRSIYSLL